MKWFAVMLGGFLMALGLLAFAGWTRIDLPAPQSVPLSPVLGVVGLSAGLLLLAVGAAAAARDPGF